MKKLKPSAPMLLTVPAPSFVLSFLSAFLPFLSFLQCRRLSLPFFTTTTAPAPPLGALCLSALSATGSGSRSRPPTHAQTAMVVPGFLALAILASRLSACVVAQADLVSLSTCGNSQFLRQLPRLGRSIGLLLLRPLRHQMALCKRLVLNFLHLCPAPLCV